MPQLISPGTETSQTAAEHFHSSSEPSGDLPPLKSHDSAVNNSPPSHLLPQPEAKLWLMLTQVPQS